MTPVTRQAACRCGQLQAVCTGEPVRVSVCHCLDCQRRSGSAFAAQVRWPVAAVTISGAWRAWTHAREDARSVEFRFCPDCGGTIAYLAQAEPALIAVPLGAFADPTLPPPAYSVYETRRHPWVAVQGAGIEHYD